MLPWKALMPLEKRMTLLITAVILTRYKKENGKELQQMPLKFATL